jgi:DNA-binding NarL/FixJ family response regulator
MPARVEVLRLIAQGCTNREIADALVLAPGTINVHVTHILTRTNTTNRTEAALFARDHGLT